MKTIVFIALLISLTPCYSQTEAENVLNPCKKKSLSIASIQKQYPFKQAVKIKLVSYKPRLNPIETQPKIYELPKTDGQVDTTKLLECKTLNSKTKSDLLDLLGNYNFYRNRPVMVTMCEFSPRNAILFFDKNEKVFAYIEVCFECMQAETFPPNLQIGNFCDEKFVRFRKLLTTVGISYGMMGEK